MAGTVHWSLGELARAAGAEVRLEGGRVVPLTGTADRELPVITAVGTDSRSLPPGSLFVALRGEHFDGHAFVDAVVRGGAHAVMVDEKSEWAAKSAGAPRLVVHDTLYALGELARHVRRQHAGPVVAVTGSNGKTTSKELVAAVLSAGGEGVHKTKGNLNNLIGVPLTVFDWPAQAWAAVVEMGMNAPGEIERLTQIAEPNVGLITNVAAVHLQGLGSIEGVARAKGELFSALRADGVAVINADDPMITSVSVQGLTGQRQIRFGTGVSCDVQLVSVRPIPSGLAINARVAGSAHSFELPLHGEHNALNAAGALAAGFALGLPVEAMTAALAQVQVPGGRMRVYNDVAVPHGPVVSVIDDTYNANPASMRAAFAAQASLAGNKRRVVVIGDMFELGDTAPALHEDTGRAAGEAGAHWVLALGELGPSVARGAASAGAKAEAFADVDTLWDALAAGLRAGDWVLVKGSRGMRMERVVHRLRGEPAGGAK